jgi:hypothetical protein
VSNRSSYFIEEIHLAEVSNPELGPDLISGALAPARTPSSSTSRADLRRAGGRRDRRRCELGNLDLCFDDDQWVITDVTLDVCAFGP